MIINAYKKTLLTLGIAFVTFHACHATKEFDDIKFAINRNFKALFQPDQTKFTYYTTFKNDKAADNKLDSFAIIMDSVSVFVEHKNKGLFGGASENLDNARKILTTETEKFTNELRIMRNQLIKNENEDNGAKKNTFANNTNNRVTMGRVHSINFNNIKQRVQKIKNILEPKMNDYKSEQQRESYALLMEGLNALLAGLTIAYDALASERNPVI